MNEYTASPAVILALERIAMGCWPRERSGLLQGESRSGAPRMSEPDWYLAQMLLDKINGKSGGDNK